MARIIYRITDGFNFLKLRGDGMPQWRDEEYSDEFKTQAEAIRVIEGCGYKGDPDIIVKGYAQ
jgi:hypothetical protein